MAVNAHKKATKATPDQMWQWAAIVWPLLLVVIAWSCIFAASALHQMIWLNHDFLLRTGHFPWAEALIIFLACWQIMIFAMMLPSVLPLLFLMGNKDRTIGQCWRQQGLFILGYVLVWTVFALLAFLGDTGIHWLVARWQWLYFHSWVIGTALFALAGLFQWSPFKRYYVQRCHLPYTEYLSTTPQGVSSTGREGIRYGYSCLGSCWALMLVLFALGMSSLVWMALGATILVVEKGFPGGYRSSQVIGALLLLFALLWAILPIGLLTSL